MPTTQQTAAESYEQSVMEIFAVCDRITTVAVDLPEPTQANWGHVGSLRHAIQQLRDVETHLAAMTPTQGAKE